MRKIPFACLPVVLAMGLVGCARREYAPPTSLAVTNSYLESVVREFVGREVPVLRLAEPGMCPGHFDIRPSQVERLRSCRLLVRFDFQKSLDRKLASLAEGRLAVVEVCPSGGLCLPSTYLDACRQAARPLIRGGFVSSDVAERRLALVAGRMDRLAAWAHRMIRDAGLEGRPVLAAVHQQAFCTWLGLKVVGVFRGADVAGTAELEEAVHAGAAAVVACIVVNRPEGRRVGDALAARLGADVVVFDNFPDPKAEGPAFDALVRANVARLVAARD